MTSNQSELLMSVNKIDAEIIQRENRIKSINEILGKIEKKLKLNIEKLSELELTEKEAQKFYNLEDQKYKEEEKKIIERRKQISSVGGNKSAKLAERELDIAKRIMESLEKNVLESMAKLENLQGEISKLKLIIEEGKTKLDLKSKEGNEIILKLNEELKNIRIEKNEKFVKLDPRVSSLYHRVETRYRGDAVALASNGSCRACFRALPAQMFNQVMAGYNLIQCPGCSRILVHLEESTLKAI